MVELQGLRFAKLMAPILPGAQMNRKQASHSYWVPVSVCGGQWVVEGVVGGTSKFATALNFCARRRG